MVSITPLYQAVIPLRYKSVFFCPGKVEESKAKFLLLSGDDDCCVPPDADRIITDRLREHGRERDCDVIRYKGTGHLIEPPYGISSRIAYNALYGKYRKEDEDERA